MSVPEFVATSIHAQRFRDEAAMYAAEADALANAGGEHEEEVWDLRLSAAACRDHAARVERRLRNLDQLPPRDE